MENLIEENNKLIAEFMELVYAPPSKRWDDWFTKDGIRVTFGSRIPLQYHSSWDWLMTVVEEIETDERFDVNILQYGTIITDNQKEVVNNVADISFDRKIDHVYDAVVKFIKFYNESKTK